MHSRFFDYLVLNCILYLDKILEFLPNAKLIHVYRNPKDVIYSFTNQRWLPTNIENSSTHNFIIYPNYKVVNILPNGYEFDYIIQCK